MNMMRIAKIMFAAALLAGCGSHEPRIAGSTSRGMSAAAKLDTEFWTRAGSDRREALIHVLWVPEFDVPESKGYGTAGGGGGTAKLVTFDYTYQDDDRSIKSERVTVRDHESVEGGGRTYQLSQGNVFLARVGERGAVRLTQVSSTVTGDDPAQVLAAIQTAVDDPRVDAIRLEK